MKIIAHRGVVNGAPENTMAAFLDAAKQGYGVECDVRLTKDKVPVVFHDDSLKRVAGKGRRVSQTDLADLQKILIDGKHPIPTLESVIKHVMPETFVNINIKEDETVKPVLKLLKGADPTHGLLLSGHSVTAVSQMKASFSHSAFVHSWLPAALWGAAHAKTKVVVCRNLPSNRWFMKPAVKAGYQIYVWGKNPNPNRFRRLGAEGIIRTL